jgi:hypothetical protein
MQMNFYILPSSNIAKIKDLWRDMGEKLKFWKHKLKHPLKIGADDTHDTLKARVGAILQKYDQADVDILLEKWCDKKNQVSNYSYLCFHILIYK